MQSSVQRDIFFEFYTFRGVEILWWEDADSLLVSAPKAKAIA